MSRLGRKLFWRISAMLAGVFIVSSLINTYFLPKYLLYEKKTALAELAEIVANTGTAELQRREPELERYYGATIVSMELQTNLDELNDRLLRLLDAEGVSLSRFWLSEDGLNELLQNRPVYKLYSQSKLSTSFLVTFMRADNRIIVIGSPVAHSSQSLHAVNTFNVWIAAGGMLCALGLAWLIARGIVRPLQKLSGSAESIARLDFQKTDIRTGDEIELLALSINRMSDKLKEAHGALEEKNIRLQGFISDISHEFKTPISLIKAYASGIRDGLDDGTYLDVIDRKTDEMSGLVDRLLLLAKLQHEPYRVADFSFRELLDAALEPYRAAAEQAGIRFSVEADPLLQRSVLGDRDKIAVVLDNFISNALKYSAEPDVCIQLNDEGGRLGFTIRNAIKSREGQDPSLLWQPYYVLDSSRSKPQSGTGLGLSIVKAILEKHGAPHEVQIVNDEIRFFFSLPYEEQ
ncbi:HAMP domain-containing histidine kinase [Paenibacillus pasadenensis]|uniref:sensor histidine kinase n=1 Tax=Paenibacillus pasadenensis TaxID=217090 RepID=UPI00203E4441|nr:HAMP domain-containing sensor histidine kinase [Paenibacillus pasadenensis]MCM3749845.1 HAMP domain-containing histidine kinase [Paenibacillus pasadenensis]